MGICPNLVRMWIFGLIFSVDILDSKPIEGSRRRRYGFTARGWPCSLHGTQVIQSKSSTSSGPRGGYLDRFGNEWVLGPPHGRAFRNGDPHEWDVQLSLRGITVWGRWAKTKNGQSYVNVTRAGLLSH